MAQSSAPVQLAPPTLGAPGRKAQTNALILGVGFALIILLGTLVLRLPWSGAQRPLTWSEAFFTATSAVTVTGLGVITAANDLSRFGQVAVLILIEIGGVGFVTFSLTLFSLIGRRIGMNERLLLRQTLGLIDGSGVRQLAMRILLATLMLQCIGALLLFVRWQPVLGTNEAAYMALFHSVSAFCNAGFDLYSGTGSTLFGFSRDPYTLSVLMLLIFIGGFGVVAVLDLISWVRTRRLMLYTKLTLAVNSALLALGSPLFFFDGLFGGKALEGYSLWERLWVSLFNMVSVRTAGLAILPLEELSQANQLVMMIYMFIGGAPASMAGGITTSTLAVLAVAVFSTIRGRPHAVAFERTIPFETIAKAVAIMTVATMLCVVMTLILVLGNDGRLFAIAFEVVSAFSNTGFTIGETARLSTIGRVAIAFTMFWGRLGPLTLVVLLAQREKPTLARYPEERIVMG